MSRPTYQDNTLSPVSRPRLLTATFSPVTRPQELVDTLSPVLRPRSLMATFGPVTRPRSLESKGHTKPDDEAQMVKVSKSKGVHIDSFEGPHSFNN